MPAGMCHHGVMECLMIQSDKFPRVFFRNEKARFWADNTHHHNESATENVAKRAANDESDYLIIHPDDAPDDVPFDYEGQVIRFHKSSTDGKRLNMAN